ncbi:MAG: septum formation initiator family protein [Lentisphaeria bacterium]|nr:septum formation initiator family protein [Lentisphaeria bacterium]
MSYNKTQKNNTNFSFMLFLIVGLAVAVMIFLYPLYNRYRKELKEQHRLQKILESKKIENAALIKERNDLKNNPKAIEKVAREIFEYCRDGEVIMVYDSSEIKSDSQN